ncbi:MAG TPA: AMP-dependent synthetase [Actinobacteria bacterium]|nr:AMP-dependent synthetase [Actinomycetota bacterium]
MGNPRALDPGASYEELRAGFRWRVPPRLNMGVVCADVHPPDAPGLVVVDRTGTATTVTFGRLAELSDRLANGLAGIGVTRGDRVGIVVPQSLETGLTHLAVYKLGAVALPLASLFGPDALAYRLGDSEARVVVTTPENLEKVVEAVDLAGTEATVVVTGAGAPGHLRFDDLLAGSARFRPVDTAADDPAFLIYTSGTTGPPKGALHAHRSLIGHLPGFELYYEFFPRPDDVHWTPADWAWIGGLMDVLVPSWYHGRPVVTADHDFDPAWALDLMARERVTCAFLPPTALKMMRAADVRSDGLSLRAVFTGGEPLGEEMLHWGIEALGAHINEGYGQTEANLVVGNCAARFPVRPGSMGRAVPGHEVRVLDEDGRPVVGEQGEIAVRGPDPVFMLGYWNRPDATAAKYRGDWLLTGDLGVEDDDGYLWFVSRKDDVITSRGYRIGPGEIEESLMGHPAVAMCAVVGVPDELRGQVPKAFVVLRDGYEPGPDLAAALREHVRTRLAAHEVPREVEFLDDLPRTTTGKILRRALRGG